MAELQVGVVDVIVVDEDGAGEWRVLALRRAAGTRCPGSWEVVHGRIERGETPEVAARREVGEETGLAIDRLYTVGCQPFYLPRAGVVQVAVVFVAFVAGGDVQPDGEHDRSEWLSVDGAAERLTWPRTVHALRDSRRLLSADRLPLVTDVLLVDG